MDTKLKTISCPHCGYEANNISITDFCKKISVNRTIFINYLLNNKYIYIQY